MVEARFKVAFWDEKEEHSTVLCQIEYIYQLSSSFTELTIFFCIMGLLCHHYTER